MRVIDVMTPEVETAQAGDTVLQAAEKMLKKNVGSLPVYEGDVLIGMVTDRDIVVRGIAKSLDPKLSRVEHVMTWRADYCFEDSDLIEAVEIMENKKVRRLVVLDREGLLAGILSLDDIALRAHDKKLVEEVLETVASPYSGRRDLTGG